MRLLIDTQIFIWAVMDSEKLTAQARQIMLDAGEVFVSAASIWEIAIKAKLGRLEGNPKDSLLPLTKAVSESWSFRPAMQRRCMYCRFIIAIRSIGC